MTFDEQTWDVIRRMKIGGTRWELLPDEPKKLETKKPLWIEYEEVSPQLAEEVIPKKPKNESPKNRQKRKPKK